MSSLGICLGHTACTVSGRFGFLFDLVGKKYRFFYVNEVMFRENKTYIRGTKTYFEVKRGN